MRRPLLWRPTLPNRSRSCNSMRRIIFATFCMRPTCWEEVMESTSSSKAGGGGGDTHMYRGAVGSAGGGIVARPAARRLSVKQTGAAQLVSFACFFFYLSFFFGQANFHFMHCCRTSLHSATPRPRSLLFRFALAPQYGSKCFLEGTDGARFSSLIVLVSCTNFQTNIALILGKKGTFQSLTAVFNTLPPYVIND